MSKAVYAKINAISSSITKVEKSSRNSFHNYMYQGWDAVLVALKSACNEHGLVILVEPVDQSTIPIVTSKGNEKNTLTVYYKFTFADVDTGETVQIHNIGQATLEDDKAYNKCQTAAYKYMALKVFQITVSDEDADTDAGSVELTTPEPVQPGIPKNAWKAVEKQCKARNVDILAFNDLVKEKGLSDAKEIAAFFNEKYPEAQSA